MKLKIFLLTGLIIFCMGVVIFAQGYKPESHDQLWEYKHGLAAKQNTKDCTVCHKNEKTCLDCHKQTFNSKNKPNSHKGNYNLVHQLDAKRNASTCTTCHESNSCLKCHQSLNKAVSAIPTLVGTNPNQPQSHKLANWRTALHPAYAKKNLSSCQTCHPNLYTVSPCTTCHGGKSNISGSPHPANFNRTQFKNLTVCYKCHGNGVDGPSAGPLP